MRSESVIRRTFFPRINYVYYGWNYSTQIILVVLILSDILIPFLIDKPTLRDIIID